MAKSKWTQTKYPGIYKYELKSGIKYGIRVRYQDDNLVWKEKSESGFPTISSARSRRTELENTINKDMSTTFNGDKITFKTWFEQYYKLMEPTWTVDSRANVRVQYEKHLSFFDNITLSKITLSSYQSFINNKLAKGLAISTVTVLNQRMMAIINSAVNHGILTRNKLKTVVIKKQGISESKDKIIDLELMEKLDNLAKELKPLHYGMYVLMRIGWRNGEILGLTKRAINIIDDSTIELSVLETRTRAAEKAAPKTQSSYRINKVTGEFAKAIIEAMSTAEAKYKSNGLKFNEDSRIFVNSRAKTFSDIRPRRMVKKLGDELNVHIHPHMFRHSFASHAIGAGVSVVEVANWLGHSKIDMTLDTYAHSTNHSQSKIIDFANN